MGSMPHPVTAISVEAGVTLAWTAAQVEVLLGRHPLILRNAARLFSRQIEELLQRVRELTTERVEQRVARGGRPRPVSTALSRCRARIWPSSREPPCSR
jgi:CRP-like cAMP-binding protein